MYMASGHCFYVFLSCLLPLMSAEREATHTNDWAVRMEVNAQTADRIAGRLGFINLGIIDGLDDVYHFQRRGIPRRLVRSAHFHTVRLAADPKVMWTEQQVIKRRVKRFVMPRDRSWSKQWYLFNKGTRTSPRGLDHNVLPVWRQGINGKGVVISILDDGLERRHPDISGNYDPAASYDFNSKDSDPTPRRTKNDRNNHGTRCAGVAAAVKNQMCIVGVAFKAKLGGVRMLDGSLTDMVEAKSLAFNRNHIDIYSCSWGPDDNGRTLEEPLPLAKAAFSNGAKRGRNGLGSIFVWASGNGGDKDDSCGCDGYANSIYTISVSAVTDTDEEAWYLETCASTLVATYSSGTSPNRDIATTDVDGKCALDHTGTSAATALAAGLIALALQANPRLSWRDVQHVLIRSSKVIDSQTGGWNTNGAGRNVSHKYGYGIIDAERLVDLSRSWKHVPAKRVCKIVSPDNRRIRVSKARSQLIIKACRHTTSEINYLEHVEVRITLKLKINRRGSVAISLQSPQGTRSKLLFYRRRDRSRRGLDNWTFMTTHSWGENPRGKWTLEIRSNEKKTDVTLGSWTLILHGTEEPPMD